MSYTLCACLILGVACILFLSCSDDTVTNPASTGIEVTGTVFGWYCGIGDMYNNSGTEQEYTVHTGRRATVKFVRSDNCCTVMMETDDSSAYAVSLEPPEYLAILETRHSRPDTIYNIALHRDTVIDFHFVYEYVSDTIVYIDFAYRESPDTLGAGIEWYWVRALNEATGGMLDLDNAERIFHTGAPDLPYYWTEFHLPVYPEYTPMQVLAKAVYFLYYSDPPDLMQVRLDYYFCLH